MYDVYLGGYADERWREEFCNGLNDEDITIFDPMHDDYGTFNESEKANQVAQELEMIESSSVIVFFLDPEWKSYFSMLQLGDAVGRGKQVIVCISGSIESEEKIRRYCEYRGALVADNIDDLVTYTEECLGQMELCNVKVV
jgi:hypothetical protein